MRLLNNLIKFKPLQFYIEKQVFESFGLFCNHLVLRKILVPKIVLDFNFDSLNFHVFPKRQFFVFL